MRKAYSYIRMSTDIQLKGDSLRRQLEMSENFARQNGLQLVGSIDGIALKDIGVSGYRGANSQKGVLALFLDELKEGRIEKDSALLVESLDRLSRDKIIDAFTQFVGILNHGIEIVTLTDNQRYTKEKVNNDFSALFISLGVMFRANEESEIKSKRLSAAWKNKRDNAATIVLTRTLPAWIRLNDKTKKLEVIEGRGEVIKTIFQMCINTCGLLGIAKHLNETNVPVFGKGKLWYRSYISKIIYNRSVLGEFQPHMMVDGKRRPEGDAIPDYFPTLVDEHTFYLAHANIARRTKNDKGRKGETFVNIFSGIGYCGNCGSKMSARNRGDKSAKTLTCISKKEGGSCGMSEWDMLTVETRVLNHLQEVNFDTLLKKHEQRTEIIHDEILSLKEQFLNKKKESERLMDLLQESDLNDAAKQKFKFRLNDNEDQLSWIDEQIKQKETELASEIELNSKIDGAKIKEFLMKFKNNKDDYFFRSEVNQLLAKSLDRIVFVKGVNVFQPWEFDDEESTVIKFRKDNAEFRDLTLNQLVKRKEFKKFVLSFNNRIRVHYKSGTVRNILYGDSLSFAAKRKQ